MTSAADALATPVSLSGPPLSQLRATVASQARISVLSRDFVPEENLRKRAWRDRVPDDLWTRQALIEATPGASSTTARSSSASPPMPSCSR